MNLGDLIDELRENILHDRSDRIEGSDDDRLWSDKTLVRYINEAQTRFAKKSMCLRTTTTLKLAAGVTEYALDPSVIAVLSARYGNDQVDLTRAGHSMLGTYFMPNTRFFDTARFSGLSPGKPVAFSTDEEIGFSDSGSQQVVTLRMYPAPVASFVPGPITLRVIRLPTRLEQDDLEAVPEIPEDHHLNMLDWAAYLALRIVDQDEENRTRATDFATSFEQHAKDALKEMMRKTFTPTNWGFGRNGFTWVR